MSDWLVIMAACLTFRAVQFRTRRQTGLRGGFGPADQSRRGSGRTGESGGAAEDQRDLIGGADWTVPRVL